MPDEVHVLTHVDLMPPYAESGLAALQTYAAELRADPAVLDVQILQQVHRKNHIELAQVFVLLDAYEANQSVPYTLAFRQELHPMLGAPFDDRLHYRIQS